MNVRKLVIVAALALPAAAWAEHGESGMYREYGRVIEVIPLYRSVEVSVPHERCYQDTVRVDHPGRGNAYGHRNRGRGGDDGNPVVRTVAGGVIGGVIGRQFGGGKGRDAMTALGALVGAAVGANAGRDDYRYDDHRTTYYSPATWRTVERCNVAYETRVEQETDGYLVTYEYDGRRFTTRTQSHPGSRLALDVDVRPAG
jgi:uncharacterized protein YcfJ